MEKTLRIRALSVLLTLVMLIGLIPVVSTPASAASYVETHDPDVIKTLLEQDGDISIKLDGDAKKTISSSKDDFWCVLGKGDKTLDLNGYELRVDLDDATGGSGEYNQVVTMFGVNSGTRFTLNDTSGKNTGELFLNGCMRDANELTGGNQNYMAGNVIHRNGILVDGGEFTMNGGTIRGGRSRDEWATAALNVDKVLSELNRGKLQLEEIDVGINFKTTDYIWHQIHCDGLTIKSGNVVINGGTLEGRGYRDYEIRSDSGNKMPPYTFVHNRAAGLYMTGGTLTVNNGSFKGYGGANAMEIASSAKKNVVFRSGDFYVKSLDKCYVPGPDLPMGASHWLENRNWFVATGTGSFGYQSVIDTEQVVAEVDGRSARVVPRDDLGMTLYSAETGEIVDYISWDLNGDPRYYVPYEPYWTDCAPDRGPFHQGYLSISDKLGVSPSVSIGGSQVSAGGDLENEIKGFEISNNYGKYYTDDNGNTSYTDANGVTTPAPITRMNFRLKDIIPDDAKLGNVYKMSIENTEYLAGPNGTIVSSQRHRKIVEVRIESFVPEITMHPSNQVADKKGGLVTLQASADEATEAYWLRPYDGKTWTGTFNALTGLAELKDYPVMSTDDLVCVFKNKYGEVRTDPARVMYQPTNLTSVATSNMRKIVWSTTQDYGIIAPEGLSDYSPDQILQNYSRWYYATSLPMAMKNNWQQLDGAWTSGTGKAFSFYYNAGRILWADHPQTSFAGVYRFKTKINVDGEIFDYTSPCYVVSVVDGDDPEYAITSVNLYGLEEHYIDDLAPVTADLYTDNANVVVSNFQWTSGVNKTTGIITEHNAKFKGDLKIPYGVYHFAADEDGQFTINFDNKKIVIDGSTIPANCTTLSFTYNLYGNEAFDWARDKVAQKTSMFVLDIGDTVDIDLNEYFEFTCHYRHEQDNGVIHNLTRIEPVEYYWNALANHFDGLELTNDYHIKGTVTGPAVNWPVTFDLITTPEADVYHRNNGLSFTFCIQEPREIVTHSLISGLSDEALAAMKHVHTWGAWTDNGDGTHIHTCTDCKSVEACPHSLDEGTVTTQATGSKSGVMTYTCELCGGKVTETIDPHVIEQVAAKASTCIDQGCKAHYACKDCDAIFSDAAGTKPITDPSSIPLPLGDHSWDAGVVTKEPTATTTGVKTYTCKVCGTTKTETIPKLSSVKIGDVNQDGSVDATDRMILSRYLAKWDGYAAKIKSMDAADIDRNGLVEAKDRMILARYLAGWTGYDQYFK